jgi:hypothetical protein
MGMSTGYKIPFPLLAGRKIPSLQTRQLQPDVARTVIQWRVERVAGSIRALAQPHPGSGDPYEGRGLRLGPLVLLRSWHAAVTWWYMPAPAYGVDAAWVCSSGVSCRLARAGPGGGGAATATMPHRHGQDRDTVTSSRSRAAATRPRRETPERPVTPETQDTSPGSLRRSHTPAAFMRLELLPAA